MLKPISYNMAMEIIARDKTNTIAKGLNDGDLLPVGSISTDKHINLECDFSNIPEFFLAYEDIVEKINPNALGDWLKNGQYDVDTDLYLHCAAITGALQKTFPNFASGYSQFAIPNQGDLKLSDRLHSGDAACSEISALAVKALNNGGFDAALVIGEQLNHKDDKFSGAHSFVVMRSKEKSYVFDAVNIQKAPSGTWLPTLYNITDEQHAKMVGDMKKGVFQCFLESRNIYDPAKERYFGFGGKCNVLSKYVVAQN